MRVLLIGEGDILPKAGLFHPLCTSFEKIFHPHHIELERKRVLSFLLVCIIGKKLVSAFSKSTFRSVFNKFLTTD